MEKEITDTPMSSTAMVQATSLLLDEIRSICRISMFFLRSRCSWKWAANGDIAGMGFVFGAAFGVLLGGTPPDCLSGILMRLRYVMDGGD